MNTCLRALVCASVLVAGISAQDSTKGTRRPVDLSTTGSEDLVATLACIQRIRDQSNGGCLMTNSNPTFGMLFPYPGINNAFTGPAFVGGGPRRAPGAGDGRPSGSSGAWAPHGGTRRALSLSLVPPSPMAPNTFASIAWRVSSSIERTYDHHRPPTALLRRDGATSLCAVGT